MPLDVRYQLEHVQAEFICRAKSATGALNDSARGLKCSKSKLILV
ncbi:MAG: hypothetical protein REV35_01215 [Burkholderia sp.]|nr:hypothetical protein [Burkholderia sp.]